MSEAAITRAITRGLKERGWLVLKIHGGSYQKAGIPDMVVLRDGVTVWLEIKTETGKVSKIQEYRMNEIREHGGHAYVVRSAFDAVRLSGELP